MRTLMKTLPDDDDDDNDDNDDDMLAWQTACKTNEHGQRLKNKTS